ncbi:MAG: recombinase family protein, partial [bacterium]|nr:recombinase family protein [bacterium]
MNNKNSKINYIIYCRKSSETEDRQVLSIESQLNELKKIAETMNLKVIDILTESKSAKATGRPIFNEVIKRIDSGEAQGIICWKLDRLARNMIDGGNLIDMLQKGKIKHIQASDREYWPGDNVLLMAVEFGMANQFILDLSKNTKRGLKTKYDNGWMPGVAPLGYRNDKFCDKGEKKILTDPERFKLIRKMWDLMLTGNYSVRQIWEMANNEWGFRTPKRRKSGGRPLALSTLYKIFTNSFYFGEIHCQGEIKIGKHEPMVTSEEFDRVQFLLGGKGKPRPKKHDFPLRGSMRCGECGALITAETKTKIMKLTGQNKTYTYYHCTKRKNPDCSQKCIEEKELEKQVAGYLKQIEIPESFKDWAIKWLNKLNDQEIDGRTTIYQNQQKTYNQVQGEIDELTKMRFKNLIDDDEYLRQKNQLIKQRDGMTERLRDTEHRADQWLELSEKTFNFACYASYWFKNGDLQTRKEILACLGSNQILKDGKLAIDIQKPFKYILGNSQAIKQNSAMFEPMFNGLNKIKTESLNPVFIQM